MNLYVIGAVTGIPNDNRPEFERVRWTLKGVDGIGKVGIPHDYIEDMFEDDITWVGAMRISIAAMLGLHTEYIHDFAYDGIAMLDGWENSKGAVIEHDLAEALGIPRKPWKEWL